MELDKQNENVYHINSIKDSTKFHEHLESPNQISPSSVKFYGTIRSSFEMTTWFYGLPGNTPWKFGDAKSNITEFHWIPWNFEIAIRVLQTNYSDVIMGAMASEITSLTIVYSTVYSSADQRNHQRSASLAFVRGIHRWPVNSPHKWPVRRKMFPFDDVIMSMENSVESDRTERYEMKYHRSMEFDGTFRSPCEMVSGLHRLP